MCSVQKRFYVELDEQAEKEVRFLLRQTTNLWNCIVSHVGNDVLELARSSKDTPKVVSRISDMINLTYRILVLGEDHGVNFNPTEYWKRRIAYIRRLPRTIMENRINDLIQAYIYAHEKHVADVEYPYYPGLKKVGSTETARLSLDCWKSEGQVVKLNLPRSNVSFSIIGDDAIPVGCSYLTLTKKRPGRIRDPLRAEGEKRSSYYISLANR